MASPSQPTNRRRSERVILQIPVTVRAESRSRVPIKEETHTLVVNAHGGLLKMKAELPVGHPLILINPLSKKQEAARVVRIEQPHPEYFAVAFEFERPAPGFWPVVFPPADWGLGK
ncbi:MAG TPA: PilZ domain-containing protein [Candidatus Acidoferrales bacterium]|nr:PilZ domain-containing protein [Candidatus Acidoferrales bacterium]